MNRTLAFNPLVEAVQPSATLAMTGRAKQLKRHGLPIISLSAGEPDFDTPAPISEAGIRAIREGHTHYTENMGLPELRDAISRKLSVENGLSYDPQQILCSNGAKQSVALTVLALCRPGDQVLIPAPYWVSYPEMVRLAGAEPVGLSTTAEDEYRLNPEALEEAVNENTRMIILCSPSNPTGSVYPRAELEALAEVLRRHEQVFVISDEIYEKVIYDAEHVSMAALPGMAERTITVNGFSKAYAMTGWRLGYLAAEQPIVGATSKIQSQLTSAPSTITQKAGVAALEMDKGYVEQMVQEFRRRRDFMLERLGNIDGIHCPRPEGAFYLFPDVSHYLGKESPDGRLIRTSEDLCFYLLEEHHLALVHGDAFGAPGGLRISYAASMDDLSEAMHRFEAGLLALE
jgi:aspartate/methionine/tyrosine aminotransferase